MFNKKIVLCFYIVLLVFTLNSTKLLDSRVVNYTTNNYTESGHSGTINYYYYSTPNSTLIDSIIVYNFSQTNTTYSHTKRYTHEVQLIGPDKITAYRYYLNGVYKNKYIFTENQFGRITRFALYNHMDTAYPDSNAYYIHYNSALKPDSLFRISFPVNATYQYSYTVYSYDNSGLLTNSNSYILSSGTWIPDVRTTLYYSANSFHYINPLQLDKTSAKTLRYSTIDFYSLSDTSVMPDSIRREIWLYNNWHQYSQYIIYNSPDLVFFEYDSLMHCFNNQGLYCGYTQMGQDIYGEGITWETITSVDDNILPNPSSLFYCLS